MTTMRTDALSFEYSGERTIFHDVSLHFSSGWTGVTGPNGSGKTTLLRLLSGDLRPVTGSIEHMPEDAVVQFCPQTVDELTPQIIDYSCDWEGPSARIRSLLDIHSDDLDRWDSLSYGERKRWQLGAVLSSQPDVLLLDEPTNHLDAEARDLVFNTLRRFDGVGIVISHDRLILNQLCSQTLMLEAGTIVSFPGTYDEAQSQRRRERETVRREHEKRTREVRRLKKRLGDARRMAHTAEKNISASRRSTSPKDHDGRSMLAKKQAMDGAAHTAQQVARARATVERAEKQRDESFVEKELGRSLQFKLAKPEMQTLLSMDLEELRVPGRILATSISLTLKVGDRLRVAGPNGAGKSTLLELIRHELRSKGVPELHLGQETGEQSDPAFATFVHQLSDEERGRLMQIVAALGVDPKHILGSPSLSPGEYRKLGIAQGLAQGVGVVLLDEPTNHLDLPSIERMETALSHYPGAIILITHDEEFAKRVGVNTVCRLDGTGGPAKLESPE